MNQYYCIADLQKKLDDLYISEHREHELPEAVRALRREGKFRNDLPPITMPEHMSVSLGKSGNLQNLQRYLYISFSDSPENLLRKQTLPLDEYEYPFLDDQTPVRAIAQFHHAVPHIHRHSFYEMDYCLSGTALLHFEKEEIPLRQGDFVILSPGTRHEIRFTEKETEELSQVIPIMVTYKTFQTTFLDLLQIRNPLSDFFRQNLIDASTRNYLLFHTLDSMDIRMLLESLYMESCQHNEYAQTCCIHWLNLLFAKILLHSSGCEQFVERDAVNDMTPVISYMQEHYRDVTLAGLAQRFHYSEARLSQLIRKATGRTFREQIQEIRLQSSEELLRLSGKSMEEIADLSGYGTADHFSRTFRKHFGVSPSRYRQMQQAASSPSSPQSPDSTS